MGVWRHRQATGEVPDNGEGWDTLLEHGNGNAADDFGLRIYGLVLTNPSAADSTLITLRRVPFGEVLAPPDYTQFVIDLALDANDLQEGGYVDLTVARSLQLEFGDKLEARYDATHGAFSYQLAYFAEETP